MARNLLKHAAQDPPGDLRRQQRRLNFRRQTYGMLVLAALIVLWWLFHTNPRWILLF